MLVDSHTHLYARQFDEDRPEVIRRAMEQGVHKFFLPNIDMESIPAMMALVASDPQRMIPMMGLHPCHVEEAYEPILEAMKEKLDAGGFCAVGEIGLDAYWDKTSLPRQEEAFRIQIGWANERGLPIVIHSRDSMDDCIRVVQEEKSDQLTGIFHCFNGTADQAQQIVAMGFKLGIGGVYTFKNSGLREAMEKIDISNMVLETDAPYLAPVPYRGKRNEPSYVALVAGALAADRGLTIEEVGRQTTRAAADIFGDRYLF